MKYITVQISSYDQGGKGYGVVHLSTPTTFKKVVGVIGKERVEVNDPKVVDVIQATLNMEPIFEGVFPPGRYKLVVSNFIGTHITFGVEQSYNPLLDTYNNLMDVMLNMQEPLQALVRDSEERQQKLLELIASVESGLGIHQQRAFYDVNQRLDHINAHKEDTIVMLKKEVDFLTKRLQIAEDYIEDHLNK